MDNTVERAKTGIIENLVQQHEDQNNTCTVTEFLVPLNIQDVVKVSRSKIYLS